MMMNRERMGCWARGIAIGLAAVFLGSFIILGIGTNVNYNLFELIGGGDQQPSGQTTGAGDQIQAAEKELEENPNDSGAIKSLAALYAQNGQNEEAVRVLKKGWETAPEDEEIALLLGQVYAQQAQTAQQGAEQEEMLTKAGDSFAAAGEIEPKSEEAFYFAGQAYDEAGKPAEAIKYWNTYLELEPEGEQAKQVKERISSLLQGGGGTTGPASSGTQP